MYTSNTSKPTTCWRCRRCGFETPLSSHTCGNPSCRADLSLYGETFTSAPPQPPAWEAKKEAPPVQTAEQPSTSSLWVERSATEKLTKEEKKAPSSSPKVSQKKKKPLKKQKPLPASRTAAVRPPRSPVKAFFLSAFVILDSFLAGALAGAAMLLAFQQWGGRFFSNHGIGGFLYRLPDTLLWYQILPGILLIILSAVVALFQREKANRRLLLGAVGFWVIPFAVSCLRGFAFDGSNPSDLLIAYLFFLFASGPLLTGSAFAGVKGLYAASSILRWISNLLLTATGVMAAYLSVEELVLALYYGRTFVEYPQVIKSLVFCLLYLITHFGVVLAVIHWSRKHFRAE